jgi:GT2 family glycosyltransferase
MIRILIAVPHGGTVEPDTLVSIYNMEVPSGAETELRLFYGYAVDQTRNIIADHATKKSYTHVLFVDADMVLPKDTLSRLMSAEKEIVSAVYVNKNEASPSVMVTIAPEGQRPRFIRKDELVGSEPVEVAAVGFGCVLVKTSVLTAIPYPQFSFTHSMDKGKSIGEDTDFCIKARSKGLAVHIIPDLVADHIGKKKYTI